MSEQPENFRFGAKIFRLRAKIFRPFFFKRPSNEADWPGRVAWGWDWILVTSRMYPGFIAAAAGKGSEMLRIF